MNFQYQILLVHDNEKYCRDLKMNNFESAIATFNTLVKGLTDEPGNFTLTLTTLQHNTIYYLFKKSL